MIMDPESPGTFRCRVVVDGDPTSFNTVQQVYEHTFQVAVDGLPQLAYFPDCEEYANTAMNGKYVACGPIAENDEKESNTLPWQRWAIRSRQVGAVFEISFNP